MAGYPGSLRRPMLDWRDAVWRAVPEGAEPERFAARRDFLLAHVAAGARVLDLGCGSGVPTAGMLAESGIEVVGVDVSTRMLALARRNVPTGRFVAMDVMELDDSLGGFDGACAFFSLLMLRRDEEGRPPEPPRGAT